MRRFCGISRVPPSALFRATPAPIFRAIPLAQAPFASFRIPAHLFALGRRQQQSRRFRICLFLEALPARRRQPRTLPQPAHRRARRSNSHRDGSRKTEGSLQRSSNNPSGRSALLTALVHRRRCRPSPLTRRFLALANGRLRLPRINPLSRSLMIISDAA
jgi:hypothetical protein